MPLQQSCFSQLSFISVFVDSNLSLQQNRSRGYSQSGWDGRALILTRLRLLVEDWVIKSLLQVILIILLMFGEPASKQYFWEMREFKPCTLDRFKEMIRPQNQFVYLYKKNFPEVIVRVKDPIQKIYSWVVTQIQVILRLNDNPRVFHWKYLALPISGTLILTQLSQFNIFLKEEMERRIPKRPKTLERWINAQLDDAFLVEIKTQQKGNSEVGVLELKTLCRSRYKNYFEMRSWKQNSWESLLEIADRERIKQNSSFGLLLEQADKAITTSSSLLLYEEMLSVSKKGRKGEETKKENLRKFESNVYSQSISTKK